jgi:hypothetical protein
MFRPFVTPSLEAGKTYKFDIRAKWRQDGKDMDETKTVEFKPGDRVRVDFAGQGTQPQGKLPAPKDQTTVPPAPATKDTIDKTKFPTSDLPKGTSPSPSSKVPPAVPNPPPIP